MGHRINNNNIDSKRYVCKLARVSRLLNSNSTFLVLKKVAKTSIRAMSSSPVSTQNSNSRKNIPNPKYNSAYAKLQSVISQENSGVILDANTGPLALGKRNEISFHGNIIRAIFAKPTFWNKGEGVGEDDGVVVDQWC
jgi:hypothetical protein